MNQKMKTLAALAVAAMAGSAAAQSSVQIFGVVDVAVTSGRASGPGSARMTQLSSGSLSTSRIGFRGTEDLGGGLAASFWLESHLFADDGRAGSGQTAGNQVFSAAGAGLNFARRSTVSLSGPLGELRLGRDLSPSYWNLLLFDPFTTIGSGGSIMAVGALTNLGANAAVYGLGPAGSGTTGPLARTSNTISYFSPATWGGVHFQGSYWLGENAQNGAANEDDGAGYGFRAGYNTGPVETAVSWQRTEYKATPVATTAGAPSGDLTSWNLSGRWKFARGQVMATYGGDSRNSAVRAEGRGWLLGTIVPIGAGEIRASYGVYKIDGGPGVDPQARKLALGYVHNLSKRTAVYVIAAHVRNRAGARVTVGGATFGAGIADGKSGGYDIGIRHAF